MPHHESGLVAIKSTDPKVLDQVVAHFLAEEPSHAIEAVRADQGKGVWLCFGSVISGKTNEHVDLSAFQDDRRLAALAKKVKHPLWVGFAIGGYSNEQFAKAFSAEGKKVWSSNFNFTWPEDLRAEAEDAFTSPERHHALVLEMRARAGYGKIAREFGLDYFRVLDINAGDALFATDKRQVDADGTAKLAEWFSSPWSNPEGEPGDGAQPAPPSEWVAWKLPFEAGALQRLAGVITCALEHRMVDVEQVSLSVTREKKDAIVLLSGKPVAGVSSLLMQPRLAELAANLTGTALTVFRGNGDVGEVAYGVGAPSGLFSMSFRGGGGISRPTKGKPLALEASKALREAVAALRSPAPEVEEESAGDDFLSMINELATSLLGEKKPKTRKKATKKAATKKPARKKPAATKRKRTGAARKRVSR